MNNSLFRIFTAIALIGFGSLLILANFGIGQMSSGQLWSYIFPVLFIVIGLTLFIGFLTKRRSGWILGSFFTILGTLLLLGQIPSVDFTFTFSDVFKLWPLLIIYVGFSLIGLGKRGRKRRVHIYTNGKDEQNWPMFSVGNYEYKKDNWKVEPINLRNAAGDYYFDFTKAFVPEEEIPITVDSLAGDIQMIIPENLDFRVDAHVKAGSINVLGQTMDGINRSLVYETPNYEEAVKKLDIFLDLKAGSILINKA